jgi:hypothetical protein
MLESLNGDVEKKQTLRFEPPACKPAAEDDAAAELDAVGDAEDIL